MVKGIDPITANFKDDSYLGLVPIRELKVDHTYQRKLDEKRVSKMAYSWNQSMIGSFKVSRRVDNALYLLDGQHRIAALKRIVNAPNDIYSQIFTGLSLEQEAKLYYDTNIAPVNLTTKAEYKSALVGKIDWAIAVEASLFRVGLTELNAIGTAKTIVNRRGISAFAEILLLTQESWPGISNSTSSQILYGLETFVAKYGSRYNRSKLISILQATTPSILIGQAHGIAQTFSSTISPSMAEAIKNLYNKRLTTNKL